MHGLRLKCWTVIRTALFVAFAPMFLFQFGGCSTRDVVFNALAESLALSAATVAQGVVGTALSGFLGG